MPFWIFYDDEFHTSHIFLGFFYMSVKCAANGEKTAIFAATL